MLREEHRNSREAYPNAKVVLSKRKLVSLVDGRILLGVLVALWLSAYLCWNLVYADGTRRSRDRIRFIQSMWQFVLSLCFPESLNLGLGFSEPFYALFCLS